MNNAVNLNWSQFSPKSMAKGQVLFLENDPGGSLYVIQSGQVEIYRSRGGREIILALLGPGEIIGAMTLTNRGPRTASARCRCDVSVIHIPKEATQTLVAKLPDWTNAIINDLVKRVEQADALYIQSALSPHHVKVLGPILHLATQVAEGFGSLTDIIGEIREHDSMSLQKTLRLLAKILVKSETEVQKVFNVFEQKGLIKPLQGNTDQRRYDASNFKELDFFSTYVRDLFANDLLGEIIAGHTPSFKAVLQALVECGFRISDAERNVRISMEELNASLRDVSGTSLDQQQLRQLEYFGFIDLEKTSDALFIRFNERVLRSKAGCIDAVQVLNNMESENFRLEKRQTLVY